MEQFKDWLIQAGVERHVADIGCVVLAVLAMLVAAYVANFIAKRFMLKGIEHVVSRTRTTWDDILLRKKLFQRLSHLAPALLIYAGAPLVFQNHESLQTLTQRAAQIYMLIIGGLVVDAFLSAVLEIYRSFEVARRMSIRIFVQVAKILLYIVIVIVALSTILGRSPAFFLGGLGAMTAVLMLIFKDSILGLVAGIQMSANQMVHVGDWISMPKYGADGDVIDISLTTVKVQNWDKTITSIPTYAMTADSFKNWQGMSESGGRRIKRAVRIDMTSICWCTEEMLAKFRRFRCITDYIDVKAKELAEYNAARGLDDAELVNGRRLTNIGTFRAYVVAYLRDHPKVRQDMTFLVRH
ncbi:MAG: mechanosensitive ion channel, partial [Candidatus Eisenbacteria sp.]|nr:mechanosensitive ion channel [Candidatus Eisenbacteria bacterium]